MLRPLFSFKPAFGPARLTEGLLAYATRISSLALCGALLLAGGTLAQGRFSEVGKRVSRAVVKLESYDGQGQRLGLGSGFVVNSNGLIITNYHVIRDAYQMRVTCASGDIYNVDGVVDFDAEKDFAVLKITGFGLPVVELGNSEQVEVLDDVIAIGHPLGLQYTSSTGVISQWREKGGFRMLQTTAPISPGNSGGPLVNVRGQVIGIVTEQMTEGQNLNFALPINYVRASIESNTRVQFTLSQIAQEQAKQDEAKMNEMLVKLFTVYEDKYKVYKGVVPRAWKLQNSEHWSQDNQEYDMVALMAPESAARAEVDGYLSEGIRVTISMPPKGQVWRLSTPAAYADLFSKGILESNKGFVQTSAINGKVGQEPMKVLEFVGQNPNITEPEKDRFYLLARPECYVVVECVSPAGKFKDEELLFRLFMKTFEFKGCPVWQK